MDATVAVTSINTNANFEILNEADYIKFTFNYGTETPIHSTLQGVYHQGMAWESIAGILNPVLKRSGIDIQMNISDLHKMMFVSQRPFAITEMTYNFQILLGFTVGQFPFISSPYIYWVSRMSPQAPFISPWDLEWTHQYVAPHAMQDYWTWREAETSSKRNICAIPVYVGANLFDQLPNGYKLQYDIKDWLEPSTERDWCVINPDNGTIIMKPNLAELPKRICKVRCNLYLGNDTSPFLSKETRFHVLRRQFPAEGGYSAMINCKPRILYGEQTRVSLQCSEIYTDNKDGEWGYGFDQDNSTPWRIKDTSIIHFANRELSVTQVEDDGWSCVIEAGNVTGVGTIFMHMADGRDWGEVSFDVQVYNDQVEMNRQRVEAPAVGNGLSTPQLYLMSNIGTDMFQSNSTLPTVLDDKPSLELATGLRNARVAAIINNSFSAGYPITTGGEPPSRVSTMDVSNLTFRLVDANFKPIKLLNPMYLTIQVSPVEQNTIQDISQFAGKLPKDKPTPREAQKLRDQQVQQQAQQMQLDEQQKQKTNAMLAKLTPSQQLQYLSLPPEQRDTFRLYQERLMVQKDNDVLQEQQLMQQLAPNALQRMSQGEKIEYFFASAEKKQQMVAQNCKTWADAIRAKRAKDEDDARTAMLKNEAKVADATEASKKQEVTAEVQDVQAREQQDAATFAPKDILDNWDKPDPYVPTFWEDGILGMWGYGQESHDD
jgi:hypothetical protein